MDRGGFEHSRWATILMGVAFVLLGVLMFTNPGGVTVTVVRVVGWILLVGGALTLLAAFRGTGPIVAQACLYAGIAEALFGVLLASMPQAFVMWTIVILGVCIVVAGVDTLDAARVTGLFDGGAATSQRIGAVVTIVLGVLVVMSPFAFVDAAVMICGVALAVAGVMKVVDGVRMGA